MRNLILFTVVFGLAACAPTQQTAINEPVVTKTGQDLKSLATVAADIYIERKAGDTSYVHSIAQGFRAYGAAMTGYESVKTLISDFSAGKNADKSFIERLANLFASSNAPAEIKAEAIASAIQTEALK